MANNMNIQITTLLLIVLFHSNLIGMEIAPENRYASRQLDVSLLQNLLPEIQQQILSHVISNQWWYVHCTFKHDDWVYSVCFDPSGKQLATGSYKKAQIFDIAQQQCTASFKHDSWVYSVCFDPSGKQLATGSYKKARIFDIAQQQSTASFKHDSWVYSVCFDPSGKQLATGSYKKAQIFDIAQKQCTASFEHDDSVLSVCFDPSGKQLATGSYKKAQIFDIAQKQCTASFEHDDSVLSVCFNPSGKQLATRSNDKKARIFRQHTSYTLEQLIFKHALLTWLLLEKPDKNIAQLEQTDLINKLCDQIITYKIINVFIPDIIPQEPSNEDLLNVWYSFPEEMQSAIIQTLQHKIQKYGKEHEHTNYYSSFNCIIS